MWGSTIASPACAVPLSALGAVSLKNTIFIPQYMDRRPYNVWEEKNDDGRDWALEKARHILATHQPEPLDSGVSAELNKIIASVEKG